MKHNTEFHKDTEEKQLYICALLHLTLQPNNTIQKANYRQRGHFINTCKKRAVEELCLNYEKMAAKKTKKSCQGGGVLGSEGDEGK